MKKSLWFLIPVALMTLAVTWVITHQDVESASVGEPGVPGTESRMLGSGPLTAGEGLPAKPVKDLGWAPTMFTDNIMPSLVDMADVPAIVRSPNKDAVARIKRGRRPELPIPQKEAEILRQEALSLPPSSLVQHIGNDPGEALIDLTFDGPDMSESCDGCATVPPDPEMAVGPNHVMVVVNVAFAIYDKSGNIEPGYPKYFEDFFAGVTGCSGEFDPNVVYDEHLDRFVLGIDGGGTHYCVAATTGGDPTSTWNRYSFQTGDAIRFFDYPHAGVGKFAIYMGANMFNNNTGAFIEGRIWAMSRRNLYRGQPLTVVSQSLGLDSTPQPMNLHGWNQGTWPATRIHYFLTDDLFNGATYGVWSWDRPFNGSGGILNKDGVVDLNAATGVTAGFPIDAPQQGGANIQANDWRVQDAEYRNGSLWMTNTISCNPGGGTVNCVRWAEIDYTGPSVVQAGVFATTGEHRIFADAAVNHCETALFGYTLTSSSLNPGISFAGRFAGTPAGTLAGERDVLTSSTVYSAFDSVPRRWGDYTGATSDPNGVDLWYFGEYSKNISFSLGNWGTHVAKINTPCATP